MTAWVDGPRADAQVTVIDEAPRMWGGYLDADAYAAMVELEGDELADADEASI